MKQRIVLLGGSVGGAQFCHAGSRRDEQAAIRLDQDLFDDVAGDVGQAKIATLMPVGQTLMI